MPSERALGPYERYSLARSVAGVAPVVAIAVLLPAETLLRPAHVAQAVITLLAKYPLLSCAVTGVSSAQPCFERVTTIQPSDVLVELAEAGLDHTEALLRALDDIARLNAEHAPLWRVWTHPPDSQGRHRLTMAVHHVLADGSSTHNMFAEFLSLLRTASASETETVQATAFPPSLEASIDTRPSMLSLVRVLYSELVAPRLPHFLRPAPSPPIFPNPPRLAPYLQRTALRRLSLSASSLTQLKKNVKAHGVATLQPALYTAMLAALSTVAPPDSVIQGDSPISLRDPEAGHPTVTGNYVCSLSTAHGAPAPSTPFWPACKAYALRLAEPAERARARGAMGMLAYVPGGVNPRTQRSQFDEWMDEKLRADHPWSATFEVSNLGVLPATGWEGEGGLEEVYWAQAGMALGPALAVNPIAVRGGSLTITLAYREGAIDESIITSVWAGYERALLRLASENQVTQGVLFAELTSMDA